MAESKKSKLEIKIGKGRFFGILFGVFTIMLMLYSLIIITKKLKATNYQL